MRVETEFVKFDDEDRGNIDYEGGEFPFGIHRADKDHMFFLCYYTPEGQNSTLMPGKETLSESSLPSEYRYWKNITLNQFVTCDRGFVDRSSDGYTVLLAARSAGKFYSSLSKSLSPRCIPCKQ